MPCGGCPLEPCGALITHATHSNPTLSLTPLSGFPRAHRPGRAPGVSSLGSEIHTDLELEELASSHTCWGSLGKSLPISGASVSFSEMQMLTPTLGCWKMPGPEQAFRKWWHPFYSSGPYSFSLGDRSCLGGLSRSPATPPPERSAPFPWREQGGSPLSG